MARLPAIPSCSAHGVFRPQPGGLTQILGLARCWGATALVELAPWLCPNLSSRRLGQATDLPVAKAVVDEAEKLSRRGYPGDHHSPASRHAGVGGSYRRSTVVTGNGLDGGPAHEVATLLGDVAASDLDVRFAMGGREPGP